jgi:hypothetical protein
VNVDQATLDRTARACYALRCDLYRMRQTALRAGRANVAEQMQEMQSRAFTTMRDLVDAGAADPTGGRVTTDEAPVPLHLLSSSANRRLLRALEEAHAAALEVDRERGIEDGFADVIEHFAAGVQTEVHGPADVRQSNP